MSCMNCLRDAFDLLGSTAIARACGVAQPSAQEWKSRDLLPRSDLIGTTDYAGAIASMLDARGSQITRADLIEHTRAAWLRRARASIDAA